MVKDTLRQDLNSALKSGDTTASGTIRLILSAIKYTEINKQKELTDEEVSEVIVKEAKKYRESIEAFKKGGREDLVRQEEEQLAVLERYLPKQLSQEELEKEIDSIVANLPNLPNPPNLGAVMGAVMPKLKGRADGRMIAEIVKSKLTS